MGQYQLIAFDMDGTLLNAKKQISARTLQAIRAASDAGKTVALCTGRCLPELYMFFDQLPEVRYLVCVSGAMVYDRVEKRSLAGRFMAPEEVLPILKISEDEDVFVHILTDLSIVQRDKVPQMPRYNMGVYTSMFAKVTTQVEDVRAFYRENPFPVAKLNLYHTDTEARERTRNRLAPLGLVLADAEQASLECSAAGISKGFGLVSLCRALGIPPEAAIAVGDADNDIPALQAAGLGIAMGNANPRVKAAAGAVVADNDHDGCAEAIEKYLLG